MPRSASRMARTLLRHCSVVHRGTIMTVELILVGIGGLLILAGTLGGGFEIKEFKVPPLRRFQRTLAIFLGTLSLMSGILILLLSKPIPPRPERSGCASNETPTDAGTTPAPAQDPCAGARTPADGGIFCSSSTQAGFNPRAADLDTLYVCKDGKTLRKTRCPRGCIIAPIGNPDTCW